MTLTKLSKILNRLKSYFKRLAELHNEVSKFNSDLENEMYKDKK